MKFVSHLAKASGAISDGMKRNITNATVTLFRAVQQEMTGTRTGRTYKVPGTQREYRASAPGEAPARRTGRTANSYRYVIEDDKGIVGSPMKEALFLERGTSKMAPRPHLQPAMMKAMDALKADLSKRISE